MSTAARVIAKEWVPLDQAKAYLGKQDKSIERLVKAGHLRTKLESREGRKPEKMYHSGDLDRIKSEAIPASAVPAAASRAVVASALETALSKPIEISMTAGKPVELALASNAMESIESLLERWLRRDERISIREKLWLTLEEAADYSGLSVSFLRDSIVHPENYKIGETLIGVRGGPHGAWRIQRASLEAFAG